MEPDNVDCSVDNGGCLCKPLLPLGSLIPPGPKYLVILLSFSAFALVPLSRKICNSSVCCIKANCSAAFNTLDVMKTSISFCNGTILYFLRYQIQTKFCTNQKILLHSNHSIFTVELLPFPPPPSSRCDPTLGWFFRSFWSLLEDVLPRQPTGMIMFAVCLLVFVN